MTWTEVLPRLPTNAVRMKELRVCIGFGRARLRDHVHDDLGLLLDDMEESLHCLEDADGHAQKAVDDHLGVDHIGRPQQYGDSV